MAEELVKRVCQCCGGALRKKEGNVYVCEMCKSEFELQERISEEDQIALQQARLHRNALRFEEAQENYDVVLQKNPNHAEANFGAFLCEYGIIYEQDYDGITWIPTCHRLSECPVEQSAYYRNLTESDKKKADQIEQLRLAILEKVKKIEPYDVFICYKATDEKNGVKTPTKETRWAHDIYDTFTHELGLKVFFAEKSLETTNTEYEPHIYAALRSSKLMILLAANIDHVNAPWVKNEWKRYVKYIREGEEKTIRVLHDALDMYTMPKELQKTQGIDHNASTWMGNLKKAAEEIFEKTPEIKRKELETITYTRREVSKNNVEKRTLQKIEKTAVPASEGTKIKMAEDLMQMRKFPAATNTLQSVLAANRACSKAYYNLFLIEQGCINDQEFIASRKTVTDFTNFEAALASGNKDECAAYLKMLHARVQADPQPALFDEYIALPGVTQKQIDELALAVYDAAAKMKNPALFDCAIKAINDTDTYIHYNCEFGKIMFPKLGAAAEKYFDAVLAVDEGHQESLLYKLMSEAGVKSEAEFCQWCMDSNDYTELEKIYSYGYFARLSDMLFTAASNEVKKTKTSARLEKALNLADFILQITPNSRNKLFITRMENIKDSLFEAEHYEYINKYLEQLLAINPNNDYTYFERLMVKCKTNDYIGLALLGDGLLDETDFLNAMNTRAQNEPEEEHNFYMRAFQQFSFLTECAKENGVDLKAFVEEVGSQGLPTLDSFVGHNSGTKIRNLVKNYADKVATRKRAAAAEEAARRQEQRNRELAAEQARAAAAARAAEARDLKGKHTLAWILNIAQIVIYLLIGVLLNNQAKAVIEGKGLESEAVAFLNLVYEGRYEFLSDFTLLVLAVDILINLIFFTSVRRNGNMDDFKAHIWFRILIQIATLIFHVLMFSDLFMDGALREIAFMDTEYLGDLFFEGILTEFIGYGGFRIWIFFGGAVLALAWVIYGTIFSACCGCNCVPWCDNDGEPGCGGDKCSEMKCGDD